MNDQNIDSNTCDNSDNPTKEEQLKRIKELEKENLRLRMENTLLKKLQKIVEERKNR